MDDYETHGGPGGYPPPTLIRRRRSTWLRYAVLLLTIAVVLGTCTASRFLGSDKSAPRPEGDSDRAIDPVGGAPAPIVDAATPEPAPAQPAAPAPPDERAEAEAPQPAQGTAVDARQANRWYYVGALGDGPGAIYSRTGGQWDYALACTLPARTIEFIAVHTGDPGTFDQQSISVGATRMMMNASYARSGGGTISTKLPASNPFFNALTDGATMEVQLLANRRVMIPIGPDVVKLIRDCRGR